MSQPIEATSHITLRDLLRQHPELADWRHHLTLARLVARALHQQTSTLIQVGISTNRTAGKYRLGYLIPALLWHEPLTIAIPSAVRSRLIATELPKLQQYLGTSKPIHCSDTPPPPGFTGLWIVDPREWLRWQISAPERVPLPPNGLPSVLSRSMPEVSSGISFGNAARTRAAAPAIAIDGADDLEEWVQELLTVKLDFGDWDRWRASQPEDLADRIIDLKIQLTALLWQRPSNPHDRYLLETIDRQKIEALLQLCGSDLPEIWQQLDRELAKPQRLLWAQIDKARGTFTLAITPIDLVDELTQIWQRQPTILITSSVDLTAAANGYRQELGLGEIASVKFPLDRDRDRLKLYMPRWMPMPNTSNFQSVLIAEIERLLHLNSTLSQFIVILIQDTPLKAQIATKLAAEWGSRVRVESTDLDDSHILVSSWKFWLQHQDNLPIPHLTIVATLPIPSLEDPLVAAKVSFYKQQKQDWFRLYLLPTGLRILHRAIAPMRSSHGMLAIFDNRIDRRIYGKQVLASLEPIDRLDRLDAARDSA